MKIAIVCGCLEPGKDGVGDYTRSVSSELVQLGFEVLMISIFDYYCLGFDKGSQVFNSIDVSSIRISKNIQRGKRDQLLRENLDAFNPDWIIIQYVNYSFHPYGIDFLLPKTLKSVKKNRKVAVNYHETWVSPDGTALSKKWVLGKIQKVLLRILNRKLRPSLNFTSNVHYRNVLSGVGIQAEILPLPSNIPYTTIADVPFVKEFDLVFKSIGGRNEYLVIGAFGEFKDDVDYPALVKSINHKYASSKIMFFTIGKSGIYENDVLSAITKETYGQVLTHSFGQRDAVVISTFFSLIDFGIALVPEHLLGKSGSYAAMKAHNLKVFAPTFKKAPKPLANLQESSLTNKDFMAKNVVSKLYNFLISTN